MLVLGQIGGAHRGQRAELAPSLDRIDSHGNYTLDNVQIVASVVNIMKSDLSRDRFAELCAKVAAHRLAKKREAEDDLLAAIS